MEQPKRNVIGSTVRRLRVSQGISQLRLSVECSRIGYELPRSTLAKIEAEIRAVTDVELFVLARALKVELEALFPNNLVRMIERGVVGPFHTRGGSTATREAS